MDGHPTQDFNQRDALIEQLQRDRDLALDELAQQEEKEQQRQRLHDKAMADLEAREASLTKRLSSKDTLIKALEERIRTRLHQQFGKRSERFNPNPCDLFNEAELVDQIHGESDAGEGSNTISVGPHERQRSNARKPIPDHLPRVEVHHELDEHERQCSCGCLLQRIGEDVQEQISIVPRLYFVTRHIRGRYAGSCKEAAKSAEDAQAPLTWGLRNAGLYCSHDGVKARRWASAVPARKTSRS